MEKIKEKDAYRPFTLIDTSRNNKTVSNEKNGKLKTTTDIKFPIIVLFIG